MVGPRRDEDDWRDEKILDMTRRRPRDIRHSSWGLHGSVKEGSPCVLGKRRKARKISNGSVSLLVHPAARTTVLHLVSSHNAEVSMRMERFPFVIEESI